MRSLLCVLVLVSILFPVLDVNAETSDIDQWDSFWAKWDGISPEVFVMMKDMDSLMTDMIQKASIAKAENKESEFTKWAQAKISDKILDAATDYNPAVSPLKKMHDYAMKGTKSWLDWGMRKNVDLAYKKYAAALEETKDVKKAMHEVDSWIDFRQTIVANNKDIRELAALAENKEALLASIMKTHKKHHPESYKDLPTSKKKPVADWNDLSVHDPEGLAGMMNELVLPTPKGEALKTVTEGPLTYSYYVNDKGEKVLHGTYIQRYGENEGGGIWLFDFYNHGIRTIQRSYNRKGGAGWIHPRDSEGKMNGTQYNYWENGNLKTEIRWVNNQKHGVEKNYHPDGKTVSGTRVWEDGSRK